jgi:hypothetical protein
MICITVGMNNASGQLVTALLHFDLNSQLSYGHTKEKHITCVNMLKVYD